MPRGIIMQPFVSFYFLYNQVQGQMLSGPEATLILGFFHNCPCYSWLSQGYLALYSISYLFARENFAIFISMPHRFTHENAEDKT